MFLACYKSSFLQKLRSSLAVHKLRLAKLTEVPISLLAQSQIFFANNCLEVTLIVRP